MLPFELIEECVIHKILTLKHVFILKMYSRLL